MAWNQPGGNGDKDPWGRGRQQGPPDLDEALKKLQARLGGIFGGGRSGGGRGLKLGGGGAKGVGLVALLVVVVWALLGIYIVDPPEQAVVLRFGKYVRSADPGPHWVPRFIETFEKVNVQVVRSQEIGFRRTAGGTGTTSVPRESLMLTQDENIIDIKFAVQYRVSDPAAYLFKVLDPDNTLRQATESAVREIVGKRGMDFVITEGRSEVAAEAEVMIQDILDEYGAGLFITSVNMQSAQPPAQVQEAFFDAVKAREDEERSKNEARAYAANILPKARGEAEAIRERALAYEQRVVAAADGETDRFLKVLAEYKKAPDVTRTRLYLDAMESVLVNTSKVLVDLEGGNELIYLPIDKLLSGSTDGETTRQPVRTPDTAPTGRAAEEETGRRRTGIRGRSR